ncbi:MAG: EFR1 family ferrodoxin [Promethearchaeota archaeon]
MKGIILYYSGSGNTKLASEYISKHLNDVDIELLDMVKNKKEPDFNEYDIVGFATFTDWFAPPYLFEQYVKNIPQQSGKMAFVFHTYGIMPGKTLFSMAAQVTSRGFKVIAGHSLKSPESYPPAVRRGTGDQTNPQESDLDEFKLFVQELNENLKSSLDGHEIKAAKIKKGGLMGAVLGNTSRTRARKDMGEKFIDESLCDECGTCEKGCPYNAIKLNPKPQFDMEKCYGCWWCYNHCPNKAIYTEKIKGEGHYPKANKQFRAKMKV